MPKIKIDECKKLLKFSEETASGMLDLAETNEEKEALKNINLQLSTTLRITSNILNNLNLSYLKGIETSFKKELSKLSFHKLYDSTDFSIQSKVSKSLLDLHKNFSALSQTMRLMHMIQLYILLETFARNTEIKIKIGFISAPGSLVQKYLNDNVGKRASSLKTVVDKLLSHQDVLASIDADVLNELLNQYLSNRNVPTPIKEVLSEYLQILASAKHSIPKLEADELNASEEESVSGESETSDTTEDSELSFAEDNLSEDSDDEEDVFYDAEESFSENDTTSNNDDLFKTLEIYETVQSKSEAGEDVDPKIKMALAYLEHACELDNVIRAEINTISDKYNSDVLKELTHIENKLLKYIEKTTKSLFKLKNGKSTEVAPFKIHSSKFNHLMESASKRTSFLFGKKPPSFKHNKVEILKDSQLKGTVFDPNKSKKVPRFFRPIIHVLQETEKADKPWFTIKSPKKK